jgi:pilus assembly protein CpaC
LGVSYFPGGIGAVLQALSSKGVAKVLAEPNLLVKSGQEGNFFAGSKIPYSVLVSQAGAANIQINWEKVGIRIVFKPEVLENGLIHLKIDPAEVSSIAGTLAANGYPTIDTRDVRTSVELRSGESLVLAGLLQDEEVKTMSKIPILGDIPILGALFRTTQNDITQKELVFVITPKIMHPTPEGVATLLPTERELTLQEGKELEWMPSWK